MVSIDDLIEEVIGASYRVYNKLGMGFWEKVYEKALGVELAIDGINVETQYPIDIYYKGELVGKYYADILLERRLIVEIKAVDQISKVHEVQLVNYLSATGIDDGLLINFGTTSVQVKRKYRSYRKQY